jgi:hypothetical protein
VSDQTPAVAPQPNAPELAEQKQQLEIEKLRLEMRFISRNHYAQLFNTACLVLIGLIVFYFFQRPQVELAEATRVSTERQAEMNRQSNEKHQALSMYMAIRENKSDDERSKAIQLLTAAYPHQEWLGAIAKSEAVIEETTRAQIDALRQFRAEIEQVTKQTRESNERLQKLVEDSFRMQGLDPLGFRQHMEDLLRVEKELRLRLERQVNEIRCNNLRRDADELKGRVRELESQLKAEQRGQSRTSGLGPVSRAIQDQIMKTNGFLDRILYDLRECEADASK